LPTVSFLQPAMAITVNSAVKEIRKHNLLVILVILLYYAKITNS
jgi:hypothetical protein